MFGWRWWFIDPAQQQQARFVALLRAPGNEEKAAANGYVISDTTEVKDEWVHSVSMHFWCVPHYSTDHNAAALVTEAMDKQQWLRRIVFLRYLVEIVAHRNPRAKFRERGWPNAFFAVTPEIICLAALRTLAEVVLCAECGQEAVAAKGMWCELCERAESARRKAEQDA